MYAMLGTRPDLAFAVASLSRFTSNPGEPHMQALKRVLRYLHGTINHQLMYDGSEGDKGHPLNTSGTLLGYCDADWAASMDDRRSVTGWVFLVAGGAISWLTQSNATTILTDNQGSIALGKNPEQHQRSKHIDIRYHFIRERIADGVVRLEYIPGTEMAADQLTKPLAKHAHNLCARRMGLRW